MDHKPRKQYVAEEWPTLVSPVLWVLTVTAELMAARDTASPMRWGGPPNPQDHTDNVCVSLPTPGSSRADPRSTPVSAIQGT